MIFTKFSSAAITLAVGMLATLPAHAEGVLDGKPASDQQQFSYAVGVNIARQIQDRFAKGGVDIDSASLLGAMLDVFDGNELRLDPEQMQTALEAQQKKQMAAREQQSVENSAAGKAYQEEFAAEEGVIKTDSGLLYKVVTAGDGEKPAASDQVVVNYEGTLIDGKVFDSSYKRGKPATFGVGQVIPGWQEVLQLMPVGSTYDVVIPSELAYGPGGSPGGIPPNATLRFKVELIEIK